MIYNATFINSSVISCTWRSVLLEKETGLHGENHRSYKVVSSTPHHERESNSQL